MIEEYERDEFMEGFKKWFKSLPLKNRNRMIKKVEQVLKSRSVADKVINGYGLKVSDVMKHKGKVSPVQKAIEKHNNKVKADKTKK